MPSSEPLVVGLLAELIRFDTSNWGNNKAHGETVCATWVADTLRAVGYQPVVLARPDAPQRGNVVVRVSGRDASLPALLVQGHLDVVPAEAHEWTVGPFDGVIKDGYVYGRGAVDMKDTCASMLATLLEWAANSHLPRRDMVFAFVADEEAGSEWGADWLVQAHPEWFDSCVASIGEDGAVFTPATALDGSPVRLYPIACGERGTLQIRLTAHGSSGHGSRPTGNDAIHKLVQALARITTHQWPMRLSKLVSDQLVATAEALGMALDLSDEASVWAVIDQLGDAAGALRYTVRTSATPTVLDAGYKINVIPSIAHAEVDVRCPPGTLAETAATLAELVGDQVEYSYLSRTEPLESDAASPWFAAMKAAILAHDPDASVVPYCMGGGTDAKSFAKLGITTYGFTPRGEDPAGLRSSGMHGKDERMPVSSLVIGHAMLRSFLDEI